MEFLLEVNSCVLNTGRYPNEAQKTIGISGFHKKTVTENLSLLTKKSSASRFELANLYTNHDWMSAFDKE